MGSCFCEAGRRITPEFHLASLKGQNERIAVLKGKLEAAEKRAFEAHKAALSAFFQEKVQRRRAEKAEAAKGDE